MKSFIYYHTDSFFFSFCKQKCNYRVKFMVKQGISLGIYISIHWLSWIQVQVVIVQVQAAQGIVLWGFILDRSIVDQGLSMKVMKHVGRISIESDKLNLKDTLKFEKIKLKTSIACLHQVKVKFYYNYLIIFYIGFLRFHQKN